jgi:NADH-quinone oxidoreductase subunit L
MLELSEFALIMVAIVGAASTFFAATTAICSNDLKRIVAFSTISQVSYIMIAVGQREVYLKCYKKLGTPKG